MQRQNVLAKGVIDLVMAHRTDLYHLPGLAGEVDGHGGDRIRSKVEQMLSKFAMDNDVDVGVVKSKGNGSKKRKVADDDGDGQEAKKVVKAAQETQSGATVSSAIEIE